MQLPLFTSSAGVTSISELRIEKPIGAIGIEILGTNLDFTEKITIRKQSSAGGTKNIVTQGIITELMEINTHKQGFFVKSATRVRGYISLSDFGALQLGPDEYIDISISGANTTGATYQVYGIEMGNVSNHATIYERQFMPTGGTTKTFNIDVSEWVAIQKANVSEVQFTYKNGKTCTYKPVELDIISDQNNSLVYVAAQDAANVITGLVSGSSVVWTLPVTDAVSMTITQTSSNVSTFVYFLDTQ